VCFLVVVGDYGSLLMARWRLDDANLMLFAAHLLLVYGTLSRCLYLVKPNKINNGLRLSWQAFLGASFGIVVIRFILFFLLLMLHVVVERNRFAYEQVRTRKSKGYVLQSIRATRMFDLLTSMQ